MVTYASYPQCPALYKKANEQRNVMTLISDKTEKLPGCSSLFPSKETIFPPPFSTSILQNVVVWNQHWVFRYIHSSRRNGRNPFGTFVPHLKNLLMGVGVKGWNKCWTSCWSVFREESARLVANSTSIAQRFRPKRPCPPLRGLGDFTVRAFPNRLWSWTLTWSALMILCRCKRNRQLHLLFLFVFSDNSLWYLDHITRLSKALGLGISLWVNNQLRGLIHGIRQWDKLDCLTGIEGCRARTLAACTSTAVHSSVLRTVRFSAINTLVSSRAGAAAIKDRNRARGLELIVGWILFVKGFFFLDSEASITEGVFTKVGKPLKLNNVFILQQGSRTN